MTATRRGFIALAGAAALRGQTAALRRGREIADKAVYALGGDGFRMMRARTEIGRAASFYLDKITGLSPARIYTKYTAEVSKSATGPIIEEQRQVFGKKQDDAVILTAESGWEVTFRGARPLTDERFRQFLDTTQRDIFYILRARIDEPGMTFESKGRDVVENAPVETLEIYDSENRTITAWIHADTYLPVKQSFTHWDPVVSDRREEVTRYTKYREAGNGVMWPHDVQRERDQQKIFELYADKVMVGDDLANSLFELPSGVTVLKN
jgi:hypothetical protein